MIVISAAILSTVADVSGAGREHERFKAAPKVFIVLGLLSRVTRNRAEWLVHENFDRLQLCSFSQQQMFFPRGYARVYEAARMYVYTPLSPLRLLYNFTEIPISRWEAPLEQKKENNNNINYLFYKRVNRIA